MSTLIHMGGRTVSPFLQKLYALVSDTATNAIVSWTPDGAAFEIHDRSRLESTVLPEYFAHNKLSSLIRQLNMYSFHKAKKTTSVYYHPSFHRDHPEQLPDIRRKRRMSSKSKAASRSPQPPARATSHMNLRKRKRTRVVPDESYLSSHDDEEAGSAHGVAPMEQEAARGKEASPACPAAADGRGARSRAHVSSEDAGTVAKLTAKVDMLTKSHMALTHLVKRLTRVVERACPDHVRQVLVEEGVLPQMSIPVAPPTGPTSTGKGAAGPVPTAGVPRVGARSSSGNKKPAPPGVGLPGLANIAAASSASSAGPFNVPVSPFGLPSRACILPSPGSLDALLNESLDTALGSEGPAHTGAAGNNNNDDDVNPRPIKRSRSFQTVPAILFLESPHGATPSDALNSASASERTHEVPHWMHLVQSGAS